MQVNIVQLFNGDVKMEHHYHLAVSHLKESISLSKVSTKRIVAFTK